jgi:hypothetical protein
MSIYSSKLTSGGCAALRCGFVWRTMAGFGWTAEPLERSERPTACGQAVRITKLPLSPESVLQALREARR